MDCAAIWGRSDQLRFHKKKEGVLRGSKTNLGGLTVTPHSLQENYFFNGAILPLALSSEGSPQRDPQTEKPDTSLNFPGPL